MCIKTDGAHIARRFFNGSDSHVKKFKKIMIKKQKHGKVNTNSVAFGNKSGRGGEVGVFARRLSFTV